MATTLLPIKGCRASLLCAACITFVWKMASQLCLPFSRSAGVIGAGHVLAVEGAFDGYRVGSHDDVLLIGEAVVIGDLKRLHVPFLHGLQFLGHIRGAGVVNAADIFIHDLFELRFVLVLEGLPAAFSFASIAVLSGVAAFEPAIVVSKAIIA